MFSQSPQVVLDGFARGRLTLAEAMRKMVWHLVANHEHSCLFN